MQPGEAASVSSKGQESLRIYVNRSTTHTQLLRIAASYGIKQVEYPSAGDFHFLHEPAREEINEVAEVIKGGGACLMCITSHKVLSNVKIKVAEESRFESFSLLPSDFIPNEIKKIDAQGFEVTEAPPEWSFPSGSNQKYCLYRTFGRGLLYLTTADLFSDRYINECGNFRLFARILARYAPKRREIPNTALTVIPEDLCVSFDLMDEGYRLDNAYDVCIVANNVERWCDVLEKVKGGKGAIFTHSPGLVEQVNEVLADYGIEVSNERVEGGWRNQKHPVGQRLTLDTYLWGPHIVYGGEPILLSRDGTKSVAVSFTVGRGAAVLIPDYTALGFRYSMARELIVECIRWMSGTIT